MNLKKGVQLKAGVKIKPQPVQTVPQKPKPYEGVRKVYAGTTKKSA